MTASTVEFVAGAASYELRWTVEDRLEQEFSRLREVERPALLSRFDAADDKADIARLGRAIAITDYRIAAIAHQLGTHHDPHPDERVCPSCAVLLDRGAGAQWFLLAAFPDEDLPIIASDSALGRAVIGARPGETVEYPAPAGPQTARVIALEASWTARAF